MSDQTRKHSPGPWRAGKFSSIVGLPISAQPDPTLNSVNVATCYGLNAEANAARIVACINYCEGVTTEGLNDGGEFVRLPRLLELERKYREERDEADDNARHHADICRTAILDLEAIKTERDSLKALNAELVAEAAELLRHAEYADGLATVRTQDCEALEATLAKARAS